MNKEIEEKSRYCLNCKTKPCTLKGCPLGNDIPEIIKKVKENDYLEAYKILSKTTVLPGICGRICPHKKQCQGSCVRGIKGEPVEIGNIEASVFDEVIKKGYKLKDVFGIEQSDTRLKDKKVAVIGSGPASLTCAAFLAREGVNVTVYEKKSYLGGLLVHGIPEFRLPKEIVEKTIQNILDIGIEVKLNKELGRNLEFDELKKNYDKIFIGIGANISSKMGIEGESLNGVFGGNELLEYKLHPDYKDKKVAVIGGGNVAMDCARTIKKMGAKEVTVIYRREEEQMPAEQKEIQEAKEEKIEFLFKNNLIKIIGQKDVKKVELIKTELIKKEGETRLVPVDIENTNYTIDVDYVVMAIGSKASEEVKKLGLETDKYEKIKVNERYQTSDKNIFSAGDVAGVKGTVAWAAKSGRDAAKNIIEDLKQEI